MKKIAKSSLLFLMLFGPSYLVLGQVNVTNHTYNSAYYVGWDSPNDLPFKIGTAPTQYLTLTSNGDLNLNSPLKSYQINGNPILWYNNNTNDLFLGVNAGNGAMSGHSNTLVGNNAGNSLLSGEFNSALGFEALKNCTTKSKNTAIGYKALTSLSTNAFPASSGNTAVGFESLFNHNAYGACAFGYNTAHQNTTGCSARSRCVLNYLLVL